MRRRIHTLLGLLLVAGVPALAQTGGSGHTPLYLFNVNYPITSGDINYQGSGGSGVVGTEFQLVSGDVPAGTVVYVTDLGFYAGTNGEWPGNGFPSSGTEGASGTVWTNHGVALYGPNTSGETSSGQAGSTTFSNILASGMVAAGSPVDANGFAWVTLSSPVALVAGDWYLLLATNPPTSPDPYLTPDAGSHATIMTTRGTPIGDSGVDGVDTPFFINEAAYANGGYAYSYSCYLGPNLQWTNVGSLTNVPYTAFINPRSLVCTNFQGWGTSLCWWANVVGGYPNRQVYCNMAFSQLKLNIVRYNIGGGENPALGYLDTGDYRAYMQGFEPTNGVWNWNADLNQRWILQQSLSLGANLVDAFANSPPWWMTYSGSVTGAGPANEGTNNLQVAYENTFAQYLSTVVSNLTVLDGVHFNYITPMNEPAADWWYYNPGAQEGCHMNSDQEARIVNNLRAQLNVQAPFIGIDAPEDYYESSDITDLNAYTSGALGSVALASTHTYDANNPAGLQSVAVSAGKPVWVCEYGDGDATGLPMAQRIHDDITGLGARGWVYWQFVDNAGGWGFLYNPLVAPTNSSYTTTYTINQKFYTMGQFSEFVRPGCDILSVNDSYTLAAFNPTNSTLVLVMVNTNISGLNVAYNLGAFTTLPSQAAVYQTAGSLSENLANLSSLPVANRQFTASVPGRSVTTFVFTNVTLAPEIVATPFNSTNFLTLYAGAAATLSSSAFGNQPLNFQWFSNGVPLAGATNPGYMPLTGAPASTNLYDCIVTNITGCATSSMWSVSILPPPSAAYPREILAMHPAGYWRLDETPNNGSGNQGTICHDYAAGNNGVYSNAVLAQTGYNTTTDPAEDATLFGLFLPTNSAVSQIGNIDFSAPANEDAEFSVIAWVKGNAQTVDAGIVAKGYGGGGEQFVLDTGSDSMANHGFRFFVHDALGNACAANATNMPNGNWHQLAGVCDESNGAVHLYIDGVDKADGSIRPGMALLETSGGDAPGASLISIGSRSGSQTSIGLTNQFAGTIDDVAIYGYALSSNQVALAYQAATNVNFIVVNPDPTNIIFSVTDGLLTLTWPSDHLGWQLQAQTNSASIGIDTNWANYNPSTTTTSVSMPINLTNGTVFYRLIYTP